MMVKGFFLGEEHQQPDDHGVENGHGNGSRTQILGQPGQFMAFKTDAVDHHFDGGVEQLDNQQQDKAAGQQGAFDIGVAEPVGQGEQHQAGKQLLAEGLLVAIGGGEAQVRAVHGPF